MKSMSGKESFSKSHETKDQYSVPTSNLGQSMGKTEEYYHASKASANMNSKMGDNTAKKQYSN